MCALSTDKLVERYDGQVIALTCKAATTIYKGSLVAIDATGYAVPAANSAAGPPNARTSVVMRACQRLGPWSRDHPDDASTVPSRPEGQRRPPHGGRRAGRRPAVTAVVPAPRRAGGQRCGG